MKNMSMDQVQFLHPYVFELCKYEQFIGTLHCTQVGVVMGKFDNDSDGLLDIDEFKSLMNKNQKKKEV